MRSTLFGIFVLASVISQVSSLTFPFAKNSNNHGACTVQVCQNKDCCKRWTMTYERLPEILHDLLPPDVAEWVTVETTGCLSLCGKGPNISIKKRGSKDVFLNGITGPMSLADELEEHLSVTIPSKLVAAITVMEKARKAPLTEKDRFYSSIIQVLSTDPLLCRSYAYARAHVLRAQARHEEGRFDEALQDSFEALRIHNKASSSLASAAVAPMAWRTVADCYRSQGQVDRSVEALRQWASSNPSYRAKAAKEIEELLETAISDASA